MANLSFGSAGSRLAVCALITALFDSSISAQVVGQTTLPSGASKEFHSAVARGVAPRQVGLETSAEAMETVSGPHPYISSPFGWRRHPILGVRRQHAGVDLPGRTGTPIHATGAGLVTAASWAGGYGNLVQIDHAGGVQTRYGHLSRIMVRPGAIVRQGQVIGQMGSTGRSTGPHVHYEVRVDGLAVDPVRYMGQTIPKYETRWAEAAAVSPRWTGWGAGSTSLPEARIK